MSIAVHIVAVLFISIISYLLMYFSIGFIKKHDKEHGITFANKEKVCSIMVFIILFSILRVKHTNTLYFYFYSYVTCYLFICGFIDCQVKKVYDFFHYFTILIGITYIFFTTTSYDVRIGIFIQFIFFSVFMVFSCKLSALGDGDVFLLISLLLFLIKKDTLVSIEIFCILIILANGIFVLSNMKYFIIRKLKMKQSLPFVPSLAVSTYLVFLIY